jgi:hypothetical protein
MLAAAAAILVAAPLTAQETVVTCDPARSIRECSERYVPVGGVPQAAGSAARVETAERLQAKATGTDLSPAGPLSAIRDFLPKFAGALLAPATGDAPQSLGFKSNFSLNDGVLFDLGLTAQLAAVVNEAEPFAALLDSLPAGSRDASADRLRAGLEPYDDITFSGALNLESRRFGRGMRQHQGMIDSLIAGVLGGITIEEDDLANFDDFQFWTRMAQRIQSAAAIDPARRAEPDCVGPPARDAREIQFGCLVANFRDSVEIRVAATAEPRLRQIRRLGQRVRQAGILHLAQLINNQPQLNGSVEYRARNEVVGPQEWKGTARLEMGFANMNGLRRECAGPVRAECLRRYVGDDNVRRSLARGDRVWAQAEFTRRNAWDVSLPDDAVSLALGTASTWAVSGGYGAYFGNQEDGENRDRLDLQGKYDFTGDDALRQDRFVATLFYTRRLSGQSSALLGVSYANRPEFLGDVDRNVSANLGLTYKLHKNPQAAAASR